VTQVTCRLLDREQLMPLRMEVMRPGLPREESEFPTDSDPSTFHAGALDETGKVVGIVSFTAAPYPNEPERPAVQFRSMAVSPRLQSLGIGSQLLLWALDHARSLDAYELVWCNARTRAVPFYQRLGFERVGEEFLTPVGPHCLMYRAL
jgi:predicted N-acetyltransferase YhbS